MGGRHGAAGRAMRKPVVTFSLLGVVSKLEVDFKTGRVESGEELVERYRGQMAAYRKALARIFDLPESEVRCLLVSTSLRRVLDCRGGGLGGC